MKELLLLLFYRAIISVNAAVILSAVVWLAKRKEKKDERKPNQDITPPPEKKPEVELRSALIKTVNGEKIAQRWYSPDEEIPGYAVAQGELYKLVADISVNGGNLVEFVRIKPPTTGSAAIKPKYGISADEAAKLVSKIAEVSACLGGNSELDELRERVKDLADRLDRVEKKPSPPERLKEAGFEVEPVNIFNPAEESVKRYGAYFLDAKCQNCKHYLATDENFKAGLCGMKDEIAFGNSYRACFEKREGE